MLHIGMSLPVDFFSHWTNMNNTKLCPKKFLTYTKVFRLQCISKSSTDRSLSRLTFNSSTMKSQSEILAKIDEESQQEAMIKCADWLMKYVFNPNINKRIS